MKDQGKVLPGTLLGCNFAHVVCLQSTFADQDQTYDRGSGKLHISTKT